MLSKEQCIQAINNWVNARSNYDKVAALINPTSIFNFSQKDCEWVNEHNNNSKFHTYIGDHKDNLILIVVPVDKNGKEVELDNYLTTKLTPLEKQLTLIEKDIVTIIKKTTLSSQLEVTNYCEETELPTYNEPTITERASVDDIEKWKNECLNWFYYECNHFKGERIFKTFTVPFADLVKEDEQYNEVKALFGFKFSDIYQRSIPVLIFVANHSDTTYSEIIRSTSSDNEIVTNTKDWSQPCPPMCRESADFNLGG